MYNYQHPTHWRVAKSYKTPFWIRCLVTLVDGSFECSLPQLLALWFEEVVEKDWIDKVIDEITFSVNWTITQPSDYFNNMMRQAIEKHMPPQKKFTGNDVHEHSMKTYGSDSGFYVNFTLNFLRDHDLLEE